MAYGRMGRVKKKPVVKTATKSTSPRMNRKKKASPPKTTTSSTAPRMLQGRKYKKDETGKSAMTKGGEYKIYKKGSTASKDFRSAFAKAKKEGKKTFTWNKKKYNTKTA